MLFKLHTLGNTLHHPFWSSTGQTLVVWRLPSQLNCGVLKEEKSMIIVVFLIIDVGGLHTILDI